MGEMTLHVKANRNGCNRSSEVALSFILTCTSLHATAASKSSLIEKYHLTNIQLVRLASEGRVTAPHLPDAKHLEQLCGNEIEFRKRSGRRR
jgi:hypothetical protein